MKELDVLQLALLISRRYKYFVFVETQDSHEQKVDPFSVFLFVIPVQKLHDAKAIHTLYGERSYLLKSITDYELLFEMAQGIPGVRYMVNHSFAFSELNTQRVIPLCN